MEKTTLILDIQQIVKIIKSDFFNEVRVKG